MSQWDLQEGQYRFDGLRDAIRIASRTAQTDEKT
jgi:hypothetical protein